MNLKQYLSSASPKFESFIYSNELVHNLKGTRIISRLPRFIRSFFVYNRGISAITFGKFIIYFDEIREDVVVHELVHVKQYRELGVFKFLYRYLKEIYNHGYRWNIFELEAYNIQDKFLGEK